MSGKVLLFSTITEAPSQEYRFYQLGWLDLRTPLVVFNILRHPLELYLFQPRCVWRKGCTSTPFPVYPLLHAAHNPNVVENFFL